MQCWINCSQCPPHNKTLDMEFRTMSGKWDKWYYFKAESRRPASSESSDTSPLDVLIPVLGLGVLTAIGIMGWQIYAYLKFGEWPSLSVITILSWCNIEWARSPSDWVGVHKTLNAFPLSLASFVIGIAPVSLWLWWDKRPKTK